MLRWMVYSRHLGAKLLKFFIILISCLSSFAAAQQQTTTPAAAEKTAVVDNIISPARYVLGGILGTTLGFGTGHSIQGRWWEDYGWVFTIATIITGVGSLGEICGSGPSPNPSYLACVARNKRATKPWRAAFFAVKGVESISVWWPSNVGFPTSNQPLPPAKVSLLDISKQDYVLGGLLGTFIGFGSGHALQGRWQDNGKGYTFMQLAAVASTWIGILYDYGPAFFVGVPIFVIFRLAEIASVWGPSTSHYRVVATQPKLPFSILPLLNDKQAGVQLVLAL